MPALLFKSILILFFVAFTPLVSLAQRYTIELHDDQYLILKDSFPLNDSLYTEVSEITDGFFWVSKGELYGFIDPNGAEITEFIYDEVSCFYNDRARVARDSMFGFINRKGVEVITARYKEATLFKLGLASVRTGSAWYIIDTSGKKLVNTGFDHPAAFYDPGFICVSVNNKWGVIRSDGTEVHPFVYDLIQPDGKAWKNGQMVYLNRL